MSIETEVGKIYRPIEIIIDSVALNENIRRDIEERHEDVIEKHDTVNSQSEQIDQWQQDVSQWRDDTEQFTQQANTYQQQASIARTASETAQAGSEVAKDASISAKNTAVSASNSAGQSEDNAESSEVAAALSKEAAKSSQAAAKTSETNANTYENSANTFKGEAEAARNESVTAKDESVTAKTKSQKWASHPENTVVESGKYSSLHYSEKSKDSQDAAEGFKNSASSSSDSATTSKTQAASSASAAAGSATKADGHEKNALGYSNKAKSWANADRDTIVESAEYSAKHYALVAEQFAQGITSGLRFNGYFDPSSGNPPPTPQGDIPDFYMVTANGTVDGVVYNTGDNICWDPVGDEWFKIDNTDRAVTDSLTSTSSEIALSAKAGKTLNDSKLKKSGDNLDGPINYTPDTGGIIEVDGKPLLKRLNQKGAAALGADDSLILSSGTAMAEVTANVDVNSDIVHVGSDNLIRMYTNLQPGWGSRKEFTFTTTGSFEAANNISDSSGRVFSPGNKPQWADVSGKPSTFPPATHNHDSAYLGKTAKAADSDKLDGIDSTGFARREEKTGAATVGSNGNWVTLATVAGGGRASARFKVAEPTAGFHGHVEFYAAISYGNVPQINIVSCGGFGSYTGLLRQLRIITQDSNAESGNHKLQVFLENDISTLYLYMYEDEAPHEKWTLASSFTELGTPSGYTEAVAIDLNNNGGFNTTGEIYADNGSRVYHENYLPPAGEGVSNPNLLINGDFSVWQRGTSASGVVSNTYTSDRCRVLTGGIAAWARGEIGDYNSTSEYLIVRNTTTDSSIHFGIEQRWEVLNDLGGKQVTFSAYVCTDDNNTMEIYLHHGVHPGSNNNEPSVMINGSTWQKVSWTFNLFDIFSSVSFNHLSIRVINHKANDALRLHSMKLELGSRATPFIPDDPATNLAKCQRYYQTLKDIFYQSVSMIINASSSTNHLLPCPVKMRADPSITWGKSDNSQPGGPITIVETPSGGHKATFNPLFKIRGDGVFLYTKADQLVSGSFTQNTKTYLMHTNATSSGLQPCGLRIYMDAEL